MMKPGYPLVVALLLAAVGSAASAEDAYIHLPVRELAFTGGSLPARFESEKFEWRRAQFLQTRAVLDGDGEIYLGGDQVEPWNSGGLPFASTTLSIRAPEGRDITGRLFIPNADFSALTPLKFTLKAAQASPGAKTNFFKAKEGHYQKLLDSNLPGGAWFRHQRDEAIASHGGKIDPLAGAPRFNPRRRFSPENSIDDTFELFAGGRAISENLQLDRVMVPTAAGEATVELKSLTGITVREMNWKPLIADAKPTLDPLATCIPADQHACFFPSFTAMTTTLDEADSRGTPLLELFEPRAEDADTRSRYTRQLCLELNELSRMFGPQVIDSIAFTGSDPYLRSGTDVAILFEARQPGLLKTFIMARQALVAKTNTAVKSVTGELAGVPYAGVITSDRSVSAYVASLDNVVFVSNSLYQLGSVLRTAKGKQPALASQDEYLYFRNRYARGDRDEAAFLILTDATIRRWCGPQWRIANSRRTRVAAVLAEVQAAHLTEFARHTARPGVIKTDFALPDAGEIQLTADHAFSTVYGSLEFLTPIAELPLTLVTKAEADAYHRWRDSYQANWNQFFDPIAVRLKLNSKQLSGEVTVMPVIAGTEYRHYIDFTRGSQILPSAGDRHPEALAHLALSISKESSLIKDAGNALNSFSPALKSNPLGWLGKSLSIYADQDPFWDDLARAGDADKFFRTNYTQFPVALHCEISNPLGAATFLAAVRAFVEQTAPKMTVWTSQEFKGQPYVKIASSPAAGDADLARLNIFYAVNPRGLTVTLNENVLKRTLDRWAARDAAGTAASPATTNLPPWLGTNLCLQLNREFLTAIDALSRESFQSSQQLLSWNSLPILNEWKRLFPNEDPVRLHEQFWQVKLVCPGGGSYVWNDKWQTMESTVHGHPGEPKKAAASFAPMARFSSANLGLTFENQGVSARAIFDRLEK